MKASALSTYAENLGTSWLFWITLCFGIFLTLCAPYEFWQAGQQRSLDGLHLAAVACYGLGTITLVVGLRWGALFCMSYAVMRRPGQDVLPARNAELPYVSILVPAYCEADSVTDALRSLVDLDYPAYEIIFVDDGSSDNTYSLALPFAGVHRSRYGLCTVKVFTKPNRGKWAAHNFGLHRAKADLILCIDADSRIESSALRLLVRHMEDESVGAVAGQIRVRNRTTLVGYLQAFEYVLSNGALRMAQGATGTVMIVPGPIGLFRRRALRAVERAQARSDDPQPTGTAGPFSHQTFAEDFHLSLSMLALGHRIEYEPHAVAHTKAPSSIAALLSQRYRWNRGTMQVLLWYGRRFLRGAGAPFRLNAWIATAFLLDYFIFPVLSIALLGCLVLQLVQGADLAQLGEWAAAAWLLNLMSGSLYAVAHRDSIALSLLAPFFEIYQELLLKGAWLIAVFDEARGSSMRW